MVVAATRLLRATELREAKIWYGRSLQVFEGQKTRGTLLPISAAELDKVSIAMRRCEVILATLAGQ